METKTVFLLFSLSVYVVVAIDERNCDWTMPSDLSEEELLKVTEALELPHDIHIVGKAIQGKCMPKDDCAFLKKLDFWKNKSKITSKTLCNVNADNGNTVHCCPNLPKCEPPATNRNKRASEPHTKTIVTPIAEILNFNDSLHPNRHLLPGSSNCGQERNTDNSVPNQEESFPWMVRLGYTQKEYPNSTLEFLCAGSLISNRYVLTAAHCIVDAVQLGYELKIVRLSKYDAENDPDCTVVSGTRMCSPETIDIPIEDVTAHYKYEQPVDYRNDVALVRLSLLVQITDWMQPVCLPFGKAMSRLNKNDNAFVAGWGRPENDSDILQRAKIPLTDSETCRTAFSKVVQLDFGQQFCAGGNSYEDTCSGNSGAPLMVKNLSQEKSQTYVMGIVSFGPEMCGRVPVPAVYTWVPAYLQWILDHIKA